LENIASGKNTLKTKKPVNKYYACEEKEHQYIVLISLVG